MVCKTAATLRGRTASRGLFALAAFGAASIPPRAEAEPLRLRADAVAETQAPAGLVVLQGQDKLRPWMDVEGLVWSGSRAYPNADPTADVLVLSLRLRESHGLGELRTGRFVVATGAIRPVQIDGASALARAKSPVVILDHA